MFTLAETFLITGSFIQPLELTISGKFLFDTYKIFNGRRDVICPQWEFDILPETRNLPIVFVHKHTVFVK